MHSADAPRTQAMGPVEFILLMAMLGGTVAFSIDAMLPALPEISEDLAPGAPNRAQLVITSFILGMGLGTFLVGPLSDAFGRKPVIYVGSVLYAASSLLAALTSSIELLIAARVVQGLGVSSARIVSMAMIRDLFKGREMARLMSFVTMVFMIIPAIAPLAGAGIIALAGWRGIFFSFVIFAAIYSLWLATRLPEPLPVAKRQPFRMHAFRSAAIEVLTNPATRMSIIVQTLVYAVLWAALSSTQQIIGDSYGRPEEFPYWFALVAVISAGASLANAWLVMRLGMRRLINLALVGQAALSLICLVLFATVFGPGEAFAIYFLWQAALFSMVSLTLGNLTSIAMEPLGHIAGMAASLISGLATVGSVLIAIPIGLAFDGTPLPLITGALVCTLLARMLMIILPNTVEEAEVKI